MPIVLVRSLAPPEPVRIQRMLSVVATDLAVALNSDAADVWVYWQEVQEVMMGARATAFAGHCPVATVLAREGRDPDQISRSLRAVASAIAGSLGVPREDVWVHWLDIPSGRIYAGGGVV